MKKIIFLILVSMAIVFTFSACQDKSNNPNDLTDRVYSKGLNFQLSDDGESYWVIGIGNCTDKNIIIPSTHNSKPVTEVYDYAFVGEHSIESVVIPDTVKRIGNWAFYSCAGLQNISIGKSVEVIGDYAICGNTYLKIEISSQNKHFKLIDGHLCTMDGKELICYVFDENDNSIVIPNSIERVDLDSFPILLNSPYIVSMITFNEYMGNQYIGSEDNPYFILYKMINDSTIHKDTRVMFFVSYPLSIVNIPDYITYICQSNDPGVKFEIDPNNAYYKSIDGSVYTKDGKILVRAYVEGTTFVIPDGVEHIGTFVFANHLDLESVIMPDSVKSIGMQAFGTCTSLKSINLSNSLETIGYAAFTYCPELENIAIPKSVNMIAPLAFQRCNSIKSIEIPDGIKRIYYAFLECHSLTNVYIPDSVTEIGGGTFFNCRSLKNVHIPDSVITIEKSAFYGCSSLEEIIIPDSVITIESCAFYGCSSLEEIIIPDSVTLLGIDALANCTSLKNVVIGNSVTSLNINFSNCSSLESIVIGNSVKDITNTIFANCKSLKNVTLGSSVTSIPYAAFSRCVALESINIPDSITSIADEAFAGCSSLSSIVIPESVTNIGEYAFYGCNSITIYCEATSQPSTWNENWNYINVNVEWGYKNK